MFQFNLSKQICLVFIDQYTKLEEVIINTICFSTQNIYCFYSDYIIFVVNVLHTIYIYLLFILLL